MNTNRKIRVLHVITRLVVGGAQENTLFTVKLLNKDKYIADLISGPSTGDEGSLEQDARDANVNLTIVNELVRDPNPVKDLMALYRLFSLMKSGNYDIVHTHSSKAGILGRIAAKCAGVPVIIHTPHGHVFYGYFNSFISWIFIILERIAGSFTNKIITLTDRGREEHIARRIASPEKFVTIHSGIDLSEYKNRSIDSERKRRELGLEADDFVIGNIARLTSIKGQEYLVRAAPKILEAAPNAKFLFLGDGPDKDDLLKISEQLNIRDKTLFLGLRKDVPEIISILDIFVLPSINEGMGKVLLQVQAMGKAVIASNVGGVGDIIKNNINGVLVPPKDIRKLEEACIDLFRNESKRALMGEKGRESVDNRYTATAMVKMIEDLYDETLIARGILQH